MRAQYTPFLIISASQDNISRNAELSCQLASELIASEIKHKRCVGVYKGDKETSFLLKDNKKNRAIVEYFLAKYSQECYLEMSNEGRGSLVYPDGKTEYIGMLNTGKDVVKRKNFTYIPETYTAFDFVR